MVLYILSHIHMRVAHLICDDIKFFCHHGMSFPSWYSLNCVCDKLHLAMSCEKIRCLKTNKKNFYFEEFDSHLGKSFSFFPFLYCTNTAITCTSYRQRKFLNGKLFHALIFIFNDSQFSGVFIITHNIPREKCRKIVSLKRLSDLE